ncbi:hypothetical protein FHS16_001981 [Paenibacillus endophyticus]|uniref:Putative metal-dependent hydrolase FHS16_001981 n=1 Tax=Paenibacillus endophyticus TaxID=1294268 RepID=A0A7W5C715_9BACL|nr:hypothetical protein [Paenibacillus endophyticus]
MDEKYPIGQYSLIGKVTADQRRAWISQIEQLPKRLRESVAGLQGSELQTPYRTGGWSIIQVVHHIADSHMNSYIRFKLALTEETPTIRPYYEDRFAELPDSVDADIDPSLILITQLHKKWVTLLESLTEEDFQKAFYHPESKETLHLDYTLGHYAWHGNHHVAHILAARERMDQ